MREVIEIAINRERLVGTFHHPAPALGAAMKRIGVLFLNSGFLPRTAVGDVYPKVADHLAAAGFPAFRFDLPGLGDSEGELPADTQNLFAQLTRGYHGSAAAGLAKEIAARNNLDGIVFLGICGGAVSSLFATMGAARDVCCGIIQLDPSFILVPPLDTAPGIRAGRTMSGGPSLGARYARWRVAFRQTRFGECTHRCYLAIKPALTAFQHVVRTLRGPKLPDNANTRLLDGWATLLRRGLPMLTFMAGDRHKRAEKFDYLAAIDDKARSPSHSIIWIPDTTHSFVEGSGIESVKRECLAWLLTHFPPA